MDKIMEIAKKHNIKIAEDTSQACGGTFKGKYLGTLGDFNAHSFQYHKIITAGKGGMVATNDKLLYDIYHMQIMEGNIIATIEKNIDVIGHFHADGVPAQTT